MTQAISTSVEPVRGGIRFNKPTMLGVGTMVWLGSELMFFSGLFAAYYSIRANATGPWPLGGIKLDVLQSGIFTVVLVLSSFSMQKAVFDLEHDRRASARLWIVITMVMGFAFLGNQLYEWTHVAFSPSTNAFGSLFFLMTGLRGLHVFLGLLAMAFLLIRIAGRSKDPGLLPVMQSISYYWHFVDIVWIVLYATIFLVH